MYRFFYSLSNIDSQEVNLLDKDELHHLKDVLRLGIKDRIVVLDGKGSEFLCEIINLSKKSAQLEIIQRQLYKKEDFRPLVTIAVAIPKKSKIDSIIERLTEIGTEKIILLKTERTEVNLKDFSKKINRFRKISQSALKLSGNVFLPEIEFLNFQGLLKFKAEGNFDLAVIPNLSKNAQSLKEALENKSVKKVLIAIGPEGDFSPQEIELAKKSGFVSISLGNSILRVETAVTLTAGFVKLFLSDIRCRTEGN